jgi:hypothetical protein
MNQTNWCHAPACAYSAQREINDFYEHISIFYLRIVISPIEKVPARESSRVSRMTVWRRFQEKSGVGPLEHQQRVTLSSRDDNEC